MKARLAVGLGVVAALVLLVALLSREPTARSSAATPAASAADRQVRPAPPVEQPEEALVVETQAQPPSEPQLASPPPSDATPRDVDPLERDAGERLPEGWTPPPEEFGSVTVFVTSGPDDRPVDDVLVWLESDGEIARRETCDPLYSDAAGMVTFERVPTGKVTVWTHPSSSQASVEVRQGERSTAIVLIGEWLRAIEGVVLESGGRPAEGAEVCDVTMWTPLVRPRAHTNASGEFRLWVSGTWPERLFAVRGDSLPSDIVSIPPNPVGRTERVTFVLGPSGQRLSVLVVAPNGRPIENARVLLSTSCGTSPDLQQWPGSEARSFPCRVAWSARSDSRGIASFESLPRDGLQLDVAAEGYVVAHCSVRVPGLEAAELSLESDLEAIAVKGRLFETVLVHGAPLEGRVLLPDGRPAQRAVVSHQGIGHNFFVSTRTDNHGYFRLHGVPSSACEVYARLDDYVARAKLPTVAEGTTRWWAPVLQYDGR
jgi:hypothetical protein